QQRFFRHFAALRQPPEIIQSYRLMLDTEDVRESALRYAALERHLAAFEVRLAASRAVMACARLDSLVSLARSLASPRSGSAAEPFSVPMRSRRANQIVKADPLGFGFCCFWHCLFL